MPRPAHFEIPAEDVQRAITFYEKVFGWKFQKWEGPVEYWMITTGPENEPGINGGLMPRRDPAQPCVNTVTIANIDATLATVAASGGQCVVPKMPVPGVGWLAYCKDTEGHIFGIMQMDASAH
ncbi:MAG TPA: VOC family protein [Bryobacteraceae bacterium]|nr:VOC family protein [Bryobacteraceae bacterium]